MSAAPTGLEMRVTDIAQPIVKTRSPVDVKLEFGIVPGHVRITSRDGRVAMLAPASLVEKKFGGGRAPAVAYFHAQIGSAGSLEIVERFELPKEKRW